MAKRKVNKTKKVREYLAAHPDAKPKEIVAALKRYRVSQAYVANLKSKLKRELQGGNQAPRGGGRGKVAPTGEQIIAAARLIRLCGNADKAQEALRVAVNVASVMG